MVQIIDGRSTGKTRKLFEVAKEKGATIVCSNPSAFADKAFRYGIYGLDFMSYGDLICGNHTPQTNVMIDEVEEFLQYFSSYAPVCQILGYTLSVGD